MIGWDWDKDEKLGEKKKVKKEKSDVITLSDGRKVRIVEEK